MTKPDSPRCRVLTPVLVNSVPTEPVMTCGWPLPCERHPDSPRCGECGYSTPHHTPFDHPFQPEQPEAAEAGDVEGWRKRIRIVLQGVKARNGTLDGATGIFMAEDVAAALAEEGR